ncbi:MAG TPA: hypothetical protein VJT73_18850, partial [Polyangiaceae bacterium]|nr:hypothetical protein [Polyangiaceae bacterium]
MMKTAKLPLAFALGAALISAGCGDRPGAWDTPAFGSVEVGELRSALLLFDKSLGRALAVQALADQELEFTSVPLGKRIVSVTPST